jgi:hypothetical protein
VSRYFATKTPCNHGHTHASKREAARCAELHLLFRAGQIDALVVEPTYELHHNGHAITMGNGQKARYRPDFTYLERGKVVAEDVKAKNGFVDRDFPLRAALFRACYPEIELRVVK